jgi:CRP-like cAMP-binding protein
MTAREPSTAPTSDARAAFLMRRVFLASFFSEIPQRLGWLIERLAGAATSMRLPAGTVLYREGDPTDWHWFIVEGGVRLEAAGAPTWTFGDQSLIGTFDLLAQRPRSRTATLTKETSALRVSTEDWLEMLEDGFAATRVLVQGLATGISNLHVELGELLEAPASETGPRLDDAPLGLYQRLVTLAAVPVFATDDVQALANLADVTEERSYAAGEAISLRGVRDESLTLIVSGSVQGRRGENAPTEVYGPGSLVFGASAVGVDPIDFDAHATTPTRVLRIELEDYFDRVEEHFGLARAAMKALVLERELLVNEQERRKTG